MARQGECDHCKLRFIFSKNIAISESKCRKCSSPLKLTNEQSHYLTKFVELPKKR